ncbi:glycosyltransferase family 4 protein [Candidatus Falkowbacteria bacterium]|jgi:glycosyltransferase involved in cell wall biosynthesis|nr:glycosyltransferase family 4 protein [Candidatus Falkowbacteria bacterium]
MKIAQVTLSLPPHGGGVGIVAHSYACKLVEFGHDVTVFTPRSKKKVISNPPYKIKYLRSMFPSERGAIVPQLMWKLRKFDVIHFHYPFYGASHFALFQKLLKKKTKIVVSYHMDTRLQGAGQFIFNNYRRLTLNSLLGRADKIIVSSDDYIENSDIQEFYFKNMNKFIEIPFGVPHFFIPEQKNQQLLSQYGFAKDDIIVEFAGSLDTKNFYKGLSYLIKAFQYIKNEKIKCLIIGDGKLRAQHEEQVKLLGLSHRIKFIGFVDSVKDHMNLCDIFILPSINRAEAFGIVLIEAMACGKPIIASNLKGVRTVVDQGINGVLIEPKNSRDIAEKICYIAENPHIAKTFGERGLKTIEKKYRWNTIVKKLETVYKSI